ncbi:ABC transporter permease subunit [Xylanibacillus composti]|uniref:ABC transporter permease n=1 Tax=Xylanibacillus composti TaxID=1572762 RepID=A0A8J4H5A5_9BACL|nr:ABC transporter permease subunit [Xylanibacillus composti]MDT9725380.1 ABC transporter permease subunit [Xylanibacillus composti]GIQ69144.1 ABC transporter permease [Xylanibacillus composti]
MIRTYLDFHKKNLLTGLLLAIFIWSLFAVQWGPGLFHQGGRAALSQMLQGLIQPDFSGEILRLAFSAAWTTLAYAVAGMSLAIVIALVFGVFASGVLASGRSARTVQTVGFRSVLGFMRAIHELVWAWLFVAAIGLSPFAGIFAIAIPYGGILGRIFADMLQDVPDEPISALRSAGASKLQLLCYGYFPIALADMLSYLMYRFECAIRSSAIMSFIGLGGLGFQIQLSLHDLRYDQVWTFLFFLIGLVVLVDLWSQQLRKRLVA